MNNKKSVLGRGLGAILRNPNTDITSKSNNTVDNINNIDIDLISKNPFQPRTIFEKEELQELAHSIEILGIIQPITVRKLGNDKYQLISGERRLKASKLAGKKDIPAFIRIANDQQMLEMSLVENIQRSNLNPIDIAITYQRLIKECNLTQEKCSERVGKKRSTITNFLRLLKLPNEIQSLIKKGEISMGHARALINMNNYESQISLCNDIIANKYSVREVEEIVKTFSKIGYKQTSKKNNLSTTQLPFSIQQSLHLLSKKLDKEIQIKTNNTGKGKIIIHFNSDEDLKKVINKIDT